MKNFNYRKIRALYGTRSTQQIFPVDYGEFDVSNRKIKDTHI